MLRLFYRADANDGPRLQVGLGLNEDLATSMWFLQTEAQIKCVGIVTNGN